MGAERVILAHVKARLLKATFRAIFNEIWRSLYTERIIANS